MATVIDTLLIAVGFDYKPVAAGRKEVEKELDKTKEAFRRRGRDIEGISKGVEGGLERVIKKASALFLMFAGASSLMGFVRSTLAADAASGTFANTMGLSVKLVSQYEQAIQRVTGTVAGAKESFQSFTTQIEGVNSSFGTVDPAFSKAMGFLLPEVDPYAHTADELFKMIADRVPKNPKLKPVFAENMRQAGIAPGMVDFLMKGGDYVRKTLGETSKTAVTDAQAEKAMKFLNDMKAIENELVAIVNEVMLPLMPSILRLLEAIEKFLAKNREWIEQHLGKGIDEISKAIEKLDLKSIATQTDAIAQAFGGWYKISEAIIVLWATSKALRFITMLSLLRGGPLGLGVVTGLLAAWALENSVEHGGDAFSTDMDDVKDPVERERMMKGSYTPLQYGSFLGGSIRGEAPTGMVADRIKKAMTFFQAKGLSESDAAAIVGQMMSENSTLDPNFQEVGGTGWGMLQWTGSRQQSAAQLIGKSDVHGTNEDEQLEMIYRELSQKYPKVLEDLKANPDMLGKSAILTRRFLIPKDREGQIAPRGANANRALKLMDSPTVRAPVSEPIVIDLKPYNPLRGRKPYARPATKPPSVYDPSAPPALAPYGTTGPSLSVPPASTPSGPIGRTGYDNTRLSLNIGAVNVHTQATDARGIARDFRGAIAEQLAQGGVAVRGNFGLA